MTRVGLVIVVLLLGACSAVTRPAAETRAGDDGGCGSLRFDEVRGPAPSYVDAPLSRTPATEALCAGWWLPTSGLVPQGLVVRGDVVWVSGFDGDARVGRRYCRVLKVSLRTGRTVRLLDPLGGRVGDRPPVRCRHAGGLVLDDHGLWVVETTRLWLLDPASLEVRRAWALLPPVVGSFGVRSPDGRLGIGSFRTDGPGRLHWYSPEALLASAELEIGAGRALGSRRAPVGAQGATYTSVDGVRGLWFSVSNTRVGSLVGPGGRRCDFMPGAEGISPDRGRLYTVSESTARRYYTAGGRPVVPMLSRLDPSRLDCGS